MLTQHNDLYNPAHHVKSREQHEEVVKSLVDLLGGEDDEGEDVTNKTKASHHDQDDSLNNEGEGSQPHNGTIRGFSSYSLLLFGI